MRGRTLRFIALFALALVAGIAGCSGSSEAPEETGTARQAVNSPANPAGPETGVAWIGVSYAVRQPERDGRVKVSKPDDLIGSAVLLTNEWVLTSAHVVDDESEGGYQALPDLKVAIGNQYRWATPESIVVHPTFPQHTSLYDAVDMALIRVSPPFSINGKKTGFSRLLTDQTRTSLIGDQVTVCGSSDPSSDTSPGLPRCRPVLSTVLKDTTTLFLTGPNRPVDMLAYDPHDAIISGDSGGPAFEMPGLPAEMSTRIAGINREGYLDPSTNIRTGA